MISYAWDATKLLQMIHAMYNKVSALIMLHSVLFGSVNSDIRVKLDCLLSLILFELYINELKSFLADIDDDFVLLLDILVKILIYVDDIVLLSKSTLSLQRLIDRLHLLSIQSSLIINLDKTKIMIFSTSKHKCFLVDFKLDNQAI